MTKEEAIEVYKELINPRIKEAFEVFAPELAENEDERIRKAIESVIRVYGKTQGEWIAGYDMDTLVVHLRDAFACLERQKEREMPDSTGLIELWDKEKAMLQEKDFRGDEWRLAQNAFMDGFARGYGIKQKEPNIEHIQRSWYMEGYNDRDFGKEPKWIIRTGDGGPRYEDNPRYGEDKIKLKPVARESVSKPKTSLEILKHYLVWATNDDVDCPYTWEQLANAIKDGIAALEQKPVECSEDFTENIRTLLNGKLTRHSEDGSMQSTVFVDDKTLKDIVTGIWFYVGKEALKYPNKEFNVAEWSEEDEENWQWILECLADGKRKVPEFAEHYQAAFDWLKSHRPQPHWKPSAEQMDALDEYIWAKEPNENKAKYVISLYEDLKKLM